MRSIKEIMRAYAEFNADGVHIGGSDRESNHSYGDAYESLFPDRASIKLMMEIGVADGSSLLAWREIFPNATIVGMDIHPSDRAHGERIEFHLGDMGVLRNCRAVASGRQFDIIVEDATHQLVDTLRTLLYLWPFVKKGGLYVVEEFANVGELWPNIRELWPYAKIVNTNGPFGGAEPLIVLRKPL